MNATQRKALGRALRDARGECSQRHVASELRRRRLPGAVSYSVLSRIENGEMTPTIDTIVGVAEVCGTTLADVLRDARFID